MTQPQTSPRAVIYAAKSTEDKHGSIPTQIEDCRAMAARNDWTVIDSPFSDEAFSAYHGNRGPGLAAAKQAALDNAPCVLVAQDADRFARGAGDSIGAADHLGELFFTLRRQGVELWTVRSGKLDPIRAALEGERANDETERKAQAVTAGIKRVKAKGRPFGGVPLGYKVENRIVDGDVVTARTVDPKGKAIVEAIFNALDQPIPAGTVARQMNALGHRTIRGGDFNGKTVLQIAKNADYTGVGPYEQIVDLDLWTRVNDKLARPDQAAVQARKGGRQPIADFMLRRLAFCLECGRPMYAMTRRSGSKRDGPLYRTYQCQGRCGSRGTCDSMPVPAELAEQAILNHLSLFVGDLDQWITERLTDRSGAQAGLQTALDARKAALAILDRQREQRMAELPEVAFNPIALEVIERIDAQRDSSREEIADAEAALGEWTGTLDSDAVLDFYTGIVDLVQGRIAKARGIDEVNAALHDSLAGVWLRFDGEALRAEVRLRPSGDQDLDGVALRLFHSPEVGGAEIIDQVEVAQLPTSGPRSR
jgi:DNA invertase Pin-like site-specific DNA recombinase